MQIQQQDQVVNILLFMTLTLPSIVNKNKRNIAKFTYCSFAFYKALSVLASSSLLHDFIEHMKRISINTFVKLKNKVNS